MVLRLTAHHAGAHRSRHAELGSALGIGLAHLGVVGQTEVVVQAPVEHLLAAETHVRTDFALEFGECEITVGIGHVLANRAAGILLKTGKNINHFYPNFDVQFGSGGVPEYAKSHLTAKVSHFSTLARTLKYLFFGKRGAPRPLTTVCYDRLLRRSMLSTMTATAPSPVTLVAVPKLSMAM